MPIGNYSVLKGRAINYVRATNQNPHFQIHLVDEELDYPVAINVLSDLKTPQNPDLSLVEYVMKSDFHYPTLTVLADLPMGVHRLTSKPGGLGLDFIRGNLFEPGAMKPLGFNIPGPNNDLNDFLENYIVRARKDQDAMVYAFGTQWKPDGKKDKIFGFKPDNGIHNIHMNQGNAAAYKHDDGIWQDGGLLINYPTEKRWAAIFIKFQSQSWHTDDQTGHTIATVQAEGNNPAVSQNRADPGVRIIAALVNPAGPAPERETVTLLNTSPEEIDLRGWALANQLKHKHLLHQKIGAGAALVVHLPPEVSLSNEGGIITLLNREGLKVHGVAYTRGQASHEGWTIAF